MIAHTIVRGSSDPEPLRWTDFPKAAPFPGASETFDPRVELFGTHKKHLLADDAQHGGLDVGAALRWRERQEELAERAARSWSDLHH